MMLLNNSLTVDTWNIEPLVYPLYIEEFYEEKQVQGMGLSLGIDRPYINSISNLVTLWKIYFRKYHEGPEDMSRAQMHGNLIRDTEISLRYRESCLDLSLDWQLPSIEIVSDEGLWIGRDVRNDSGTPLK